MINYQRSFSAFPFVIKNLLIANGVFFVLQHLIGSSVAYFLLEWLALWPAGTSEHIAEYGQIVAVPQFYPWQLISYGFLHGGLGHFFFNMFALWMFGAQIENIWGAKRFAVYYFTCVIGAGLVQLLVVSWDISQTGAIYPTLGASGGVFGILLAFGMMFPNQRIMLLFPPIPMKAKWFVIGYGAIELILGVTGTQSGVAHFAHLGGMLFGFLLIQFWKKQRRF